MVNCKFNVFISRRNVDSIDSKQRIIRLTVKRCCQYITGGGSGNALFCLYNWMCQPGIQQPDYCYAANSANLSEFGKTFKIGADRRIQVDYAVAQRLRAVGSPKNHAVNGIAVEPEAAGRLDIYPASQWT